MRHPRKIFAKVLLVLLPILLIFGTSYGCGNTADNKPKVFMWKVSSGSTYVYLFGTVQVNDQSIYPLDNAIENAFTDTDNLVIEANVNKINSDEINQYILDHGMYTGNDGLKANTSDSLYSQLEKFAVKYNFDLKTYDVFKPWVIYEVMANYILNDLGYKSDWRMEKYFTNKAENVSKSVIEMESTKSELEMLAAVPDAAILAGIQYDVDNPETAQDLKGMLDAWKAGDIVKMESLVFKPKNEVPAMKPYYDKIYDARNPNLASHIEELLTGNKTHFVIVNAGSLVGDNGILNLLKNKGYTIEQVNANNLVISH
jgi:uncharacterized protein